MWPMFSFALEIRAAAAAAVTVFIQPRGIEFNIIAFTLFISFWAYKLKKKSTKNLDCLHSKGKLNTSVVKSRSILFVYC